MTGIVERLRTLHATLTMQEAVNEIELLRDRLANAEYNYAMFCKKHDEDKAKLIAALKEIEELPSAQADDCWAIARAALKEIT